MRISEFLRVAQTVRGSYRALTCEFCGAETMSGTGIAFCSNCESLINTDRKNIASRDPQLLLALEAIRGNVIEGRFEEASLLYDQLIAQRPSGQLLYAKGVMLMEYSNYIISQISYSRAGLWMQIPSLGIGAMLLSLRQRSS